MKRKIFNLLLVVIWMIVIFVMSSFNAKDSSMQSGIIVNFFSNLFNINDYNTLSFIIRKIAHFTEYFILGLCVYNLFSKHKYNFLISIIVCIIYAISDEIHQIFVSGRSFQITDILIDSFGAIISVFLFHLFTVSVE